MPLKKFEDLEKLIMGNKESRIAYHEEDFRIELAEFFLNAMQKQGLSYEKFAALMETSKLQIQRLLNKESGGSLTLNTIFRAGDVLGFAKPLALNRQCEGKSEEMCNRKVGL